MIEWTKSARAAWTAHEEQLQVRLEDSEADAQEVAQDVQVHIEEEAHKADLRVIDAAWLESLLRRMEDQEASSSRKQPEETHAKIRFRESLKQTGAWTQFRRGTLWLTAVIWPTITLMFELFDPSMFRVLVRPHAHPAPCAVAGSGPDGECMGAVEIGQEPRSHRAMAIALSSPLTPAPVSSTR